jgi:cob(I)alamin adenosyltransferase
MAIRITKVYTRTGDKGFTKLVGGKKVPKDAVRIEAYGTIDELNSVLGLSRVFNDDLKDRLPAAQRLDEIFRRLQNELFDVGSELATPSDFSYEGQFHVGEDEVKALEKLIDELQKIWPR